MVDEINSPRSSLNMINTKRSGVVALKELKEAMRDNVLVARVGEDGEVPKPSTYRKMPKI